MRLSRLTTVTVALSLICSFHATSATEATSAPVKNIENSKARVFIYRTSSSLILGGVSATYGGRKLASLSNKEFDVTELPVGEVEIEVSQNLSADMCRVKVQIEPLKDNFLKIRDRDVGVGRRFIFNSPLIQLLDRGTSGACSGLNEIVKVEVNEANEEFEAYEYSPMRDLADKSLEPSLLCKALTKGESERCKVEPKHISSLRPVRYIQASTSPQKQVEAGNILVKCKVANNPLIEVAPQACLAIQGVIENGDNLSCVIGSNAPIKLSPDLCLKGGGRVAN